MVKPCYNTDYTNKELTCDTTMNWPLMNAMALPLL